MTALLQINHLSLSFLSDEGDFPALQDVSFEVRSGEVLAIVGESGSGKSVTALSVLQLLASPPAVYTSGEIIFYAAADAGIDLLRQSHRQMQSVRGNRIGMIFQEPMSSLNPVMICGKQVMEAIRAHRKISVAAAKEQVIALFEKVQLPDPERIFSAYPHQLSGGQKQRVMIAMAISCQPALLICDEPTTALDVTVQKAILHLIKELQASENMSVIFITHDLGVVAELADRAIVMYRGSIVEEGKVDKLFADPKHPYTKALLLCRPQLYQKGQRLPVVSDFMEEAVIIPAAASLVPVSATEIPRPLLKVEHLEVRFPSSKTLFGRVKSWVTAVNDVNFEIYKGETLGLVGESGCGKTTLGRTLLRLIDPFAGNILYGGNDLLALDSAALKAARKNIQIVFQDPYASLDPRLMIGKAIAEPMQVHGIENSANRRRDMALSLLEQVDLKPEHYYRYPHEFSGGQRQRIVIARALALNPDFVVFDESVSALDASVQAQVLNLINDLKKKFGFTALFISHDLSVVRYISDRIMVMNKGKIEETGKSEDVYLRPQKEYTKRLIAALPG